MGCLRSRPIIIIEDVAHPKRDEEEEEETLKIIPSAGPPEPHSDSEEWIGIWDEEMHYMLQTGQRTNYWLSEIHRLIRRALVVQYGDKWDEPLLPTS
jgi:hypothetical protein